MKHKISGVFIACILLISSVLAEGFGAGTLVKTSGSRIPIEDICLGDTVDGRDFDGFRVSGKVTALRCYEASELIKLVLFENDTVVCDFDQLFCLSDSLVWRQAQDLKTGDRIVNFSGSCSVIQDIEELAGSQLVYDITVDNCHNFYVSKSEILAHNMVVVLAAPVAPMVTSAVVVTAIEAATAISFVAGCLYSFFWGSDSKNSAPLPGSGGSNNNDCICGCGPCNIGCNCGCTCGCGTDHKGRKKNTISKQEFFRRDEVAKNYEHYKGQTYRLKKGAIPIIKDAYYLQWDHLHGDVEVWNKREKHVGSLDPKTLQLYKGPVAPRVFNY